MIKKSFLILIMVVVIACQFGPKARTTDLPPSGEPGSSLSSPTPSDFQLQPEGSLMTKFDIDLDSPFAGGIELKKKPSISTTLNVPMLPVDLEMIDNPLVLKGLTEGQKAFLQENGFAVIRTGEAEFMLIREQVADRYGQPYYLTTDAAFHALHLSFDETLKALEKEQFRPKMIALLQATATRALSYEQGAKDTAAESDARLATDYLAVALRLFDPSVRYDPEREARLAQQLGQIEAAAAVEESALIEGFKDDYGAYKPVGHYSGNPDLEAYFKGMTWLGRVEFLFKDPEQPQLIPSRAPLFITLAMLEAEVDLPESQSPDGEGGGMGSLQTESHLISFRTNQTTMPAPELWGDMHEIFTFLVGPSDDPGPYELAKLMESVYGSDMDYRALLDDDRWGTFLANVDQLPTPQINSMFVQTLASLPETRGWRFMGQRFTLDAHVLQNMVYDKVGTMEKPRLIPSGLDVMNALGSEAAAESLENSGDTAYNNYSAQMVSMKSFIQAVPESEWKSRFYDGWLYAFIAQVQTRSDEFPPYMQSDAWAYKELNSALGSWAELKHDTVLYSKMPEPQGGGGPPLSGPPPSFVEPNPDVFYRLSYIARSIMVGLEERGISISTEGYAYGGEMTVDRLLRGMDDLGERFGQLGDIAVAELEGKDPAPEDWEVITACLGPIECNFQQLKNYGEDPEIPPLPVVASVSGAGPNDVLEAGTGDLDRIFVVVPFNGTLVAAQGGVFSYYEFTQPRSARLTDEEWRTMLDGDALQRPGWTEKYILTDGKAEDVLYFRTGDVYIISEEGGNPPLNVRSKPSTSAPVLAQLHKGDYVTIVDGPQKSGGFTWWKVNAEFMGVEGWVVEDPDWFIRSYSPTQ